MAEFAFMRWYGPWIITHPYPVGATVEYLGTYFYALQASTGVTPVQGAVWSATAANIPGPPGSPGANGTATTVERNLGSVPTWRGKFTITDATILTTSKLLVWQAPGPYTGKGTRADEAEMDPIVCNTEPLSGSATVRWHTEPMIVIRAPVGEGDKRTTASNQTVLAPPQDDPQARASAIRLGKVKGNVKFTYLVLA